jgi:hypothetical protein
MGVYKWVKDKGRDTIITAESWELNSDLCCVILLGSVSRSIKSEDHGLKMLQINSDFSVSFIFSPSPTLIIDVYILIPSSST